VFSGTKNAFCAGKLTCPRPAVWGDCLQSRQSDGSQKSRDMENNNQKSNKGGRKPKLDRCSHRYVFYLNDTDHCKLNAMYLQSSTKEISGFLRSIIFCRPMKVVKIDKSTMDYYMRLTSFYSQFQAVGVNYNQTVKAVKTNFSEKRALVLLRQLEKATFELVAINKKVIELTAEFERKHLRHCGLDPQPHSKFLIRN